jgi:vacuolar protein-sorting-associated protein 4
MLTPCSPGDPGAIEMQWDKVPRNRLTDAPVEMRHFRTSLRNVKATVNQAELDRYVRWTEEFGQDGE